jgi:hypothetical protein
MAAVTHTLNDVGLILTLFRIIFRFISELYVHCENVELLQIVCF